jgi:hypothetical protein
MAVPWIKVEVSLPDKPEVMAMASILGVDSDAVVGKLIRIWGWADTHTTNGNAAGVTNSFIDRYTHCVGFAEALRKVGWLGGRDAAIEFPNFNRHNGQTAKSRALTKDRVDKTRKNCNGASVTKALPDQIRSDKNSVTIRTGSDPPRLAEALGMGTYGTFLAGRLPTRSASDVQFLTLIGRAVDERHIAESLVRPALDGCDAKGVRKPIGMFRAALEKNIAAAGGDLETIIQALQGGGSGSPSDNPE